MAFPTPKKRLRSPAWKRERNVFLRRRLPVLLCYFQSG
jgi:hypothetical protein